MLAWLQDWFAEYCDGDWEHGNGVEISTIDNPGWRVRIPLRFTDLAERSMPLTKVDRSPTDWYQSWVADDYFEAACGAVNLEEVLRLFQDWVEADLNG